MKLRRMMVASVLAGTVALGATSAWGAPTGSKNAFTFPATCNGQMVPLVINNANGQGSGAQNNTATQAQFAPAHVVGSNQVFHPQVFDNLVFTFTAPGQPPQTFTMNSTVNNPKTPVTCEIDSTQPVGPGGTISLVGSVEGFFS